MALRVVVLGAGPGGYVAAIRAARLGAQVTLVERNRIGGTCLHWGCIPTKVMKSACEVLEAMARAPEMGIRLEGPSRLDLQALRARMAKVVDTQEKAVSNLLGRLKVRQVKGVGRVEGHGTLCVENELGQRTTVEWDRLILATGSVTAELPALPFDGTRVLSSSDVLALQEVPERVLLVGAGVIGCELACILRTMGSQVRMVEVMDRVLPIPSLDPDSSTLMEREMRKKGIELSLGCLVDKVEDHPDGGLSITLRPMGAAPQSFPEQKPSRSILADKVVVCVGRRPSTQELGLEKLDLNLDPNGWILVDHRLETSAPGVFAVGDALGPTRPMLAHLASAEGMLAAENALGANESMDYGAVPSAIFTSPELGCVGMSEAQAREQGLEVGVEVFLIRTLGKAQALGELGGQAKVVYEKRSHRILGFQLIGPRATELISACTVALTMGATLEGLARVVFPHPTLSEALGELSQKALGKPVHGLF